MRNKRKKNIFFIQPAHAHYRNQLFDILSKQHDIHFVYERSNTNTYPGEITPGEWSHTFLDRTFGNYRLGLIYFLIKHQPDVIISSGFNSYRSTVSFTYATLFKKRFILWVEEWRKPASSSFTVKSLLRYFEYLIGRKLVRRSHALVVGGTASRQYVLSLGAHDSDIYVGLQTANDMKPLQSLKSLKKKHCKRKYTFLYLSRIIPYKGLDILIKAFSLLRRKRTNVYLLIGGDGTFRHYCEELAKSLQIPDISFVGPVNPHSVVDLYEKADVFVLPSYFWQNLYEAWGLVINEAMSMALPVITTKAVGAAYDLVIDGYNGFIVRDNEVTDLYETMERIIGMDLVQMGLNSRLLFEKKNDFAKMANSFTSAIEHAILK